jgi:ABC-2 type transport system permease protein
VRGWWVVARRELQATATSSTPWAVGAAFLVLTGVLFWINATAFADVSAQAAANPQLTAGLNATQGVVQPAIANLGLIGAFVFPFLTMRLIAEERRSGWLDLLRTLPLDDAAIVLGKALAALAVVAGILVLSLIQPLVLWLGGATTVSHVAAGYLGALLLSSAFVAVGLAISALSPTQVFAASVTFALFVGLVILDQWVGPAPQGLAAVLAGWSPITRLDPFSRGLIPLDSVAYFLLLDAAALVVATAALTLERRIG